MGKKIAGSHNQTSQSKGNLRAAQGRRRLRHAAYLCNNHSMMAREKEPATNKYTAYSFLLEKDNENEG